MLMALILYISHAIFFNNLFKFYSYIECFYILSMLSLYPLYYLYLLSLSTKKLVFKKLVHFIPAVIFSVAIFIATVILTPEERIIYINEILINKSFMQTNLPFLVRIKGFIFLASRIIFIIQIGYYLIKGVSVANTHNRQIVNYYSNTERKTLGWVKIINIIFLFTSLGSIAFVFIGRGFFTHNEALLLIPSGLYTMFLFIIGFNGNRQIRLNVEFKDDDLASNLNEFKNGQSKNLKKQLIQLFDINKIYINSDLRITSISETLKTNRTYISKLINEEFKMNFNEFVNEYRIKEAKKLLLDKNNNLYTIEHIAEISGFGSVNSFTRVFKSIVGMPPGKFKDQTNDLQ